MTLAALLLLASPLATAHMGISSPRPLDASVGDAFRYPVSSDNNPTNGGACHGQGAGATYTWVWTPTSSGTCEIYQNCFNSQPAELTMSFGAAHDGGPCKLYKCSGAITMPTCVRRQLPDSFGSCTVVATESDCTKKGSMSGGGSNPPPGPVPTNAPTMAGATPAPTTEHPTFSPALTTGRIRCGTSWGDANGKCGTKCVNNGQCQNGEFCFADLAKCADSGTAIPVPRPTPAPAAPDAGECVSKVAHISDQWCQQVLCDPVYKDFCGRIGSGVVKSAQLFSLNATGCQLHSVCCNDTLADVAMKWDVDMAALLSYNKELGVLKTADDIKNEMVLEIPGDCQKAQAEVKAAEIAAASSASRLLSLSALVVATSQLFWL